MDLGGDLQDLEARGYIGVSRDILRGMWSVGIIPPHGGESTGKESRSYYFGFRDIAPQVHGSFNGQENGE